MVEGIRNFYIFWEAKWKFQIATLITWDLLMAKGSRIFHIFLRSKMKIPKLPLALLKFTHGQRDQEFFVYLEKQNEKPQIVTLITWDLLIVKGNMIFLNILRSKWKSQICHITLQGIYSCSRDQKILINFETQNENP